MKTPKSPGMMGAGIICVILGLFRALGQRFGIPLQYMRDQFLQALPYLGPILLMVVGSILIVSYINHDD